MEKLHTLLIKEKDIHVFQPGQVVFNEGDPGDYMCGVMEGEVEIYKKGKLIETVGVDGIFGELSLVDNEPRNASVIAKVYTRLAIIDARRFAILVKRNPYFSLQVMRIMSDRLRTVMNPDRVKPPPKSP